MHCTILSRHSGFSSKQHPANAQLARPIPNCGTGQVVLNCMAGLKPFQKDPERVSGLLRVQKRISQPPYTRPKPLILPSPLTNPDASLFVVPNTSCTISERPHRMATLSRRNPKPWKVPKLHESVSSSGRRQASQLPRAKAPTGHRYQRPLHPQISTLWVAV